ncbi:Hexosyltransferase [Trichostrongylus colubriformis]|uniref:Hexosyltransferase n=1 Tax=Trichostrongylus colubriformis TaxID=6319 RepID=A0AAN8IPX1_TRICO
MTARYVFQVVVIAAVLFCLWYSLTRNIEQLQACDNLPSSLYVHPIHPSTDSPAVSREPRATFAPRIRLLPHSLCETNASVVFVIHSDVRNTAQRQFQRKQLDDVWLETLNAKRIFVIGSTVEPTDKYEKEAEKYNDLLQIDTVDHYHNITYKAQAWVQLLSSCLDTPAFVIKLDDDVMVDRIGLQYLVERYSTSRRVLGCRVLRHGTVVRNPLSKWYLSSEEYSGSDLGTYCQGMAYVFTGDQLRHMRENIPRVQFLWMDDWYVTRALLSGSNTTLLDLSDHYCSTNSDDELAVWMTRKQTLRTPQRTIFGHFRPAEKFPLKQSIEQWKEITLLNNRCI